MTDLRSEEKVAAATIAATLGLRVEPHDDGSRPGMHDLNILAVGGRSAAVEVTAAADPVSIQLWKLVNGRDERWTVPSLRGGWMLQLEPTARAKRLLKDLPAFLEELEGREITEIPRQRRRHEGPKSLEGRARALGIVSGNQSSTDFPGSIYLTIEQSPERTGGVVDSTGSAVPRWVRDFLLDPHQSDVLGKLERSGASERHAFILVPGFSIAPFGVVDMLWRDDRSAVPTTRPHLPEPVTHVWLMAFWTVGSGLRWSPDSGWERFERHFEIED
ncbi:hypothetical protein [Serinicoccus sp. LYQ131]|uniref:hypothetical protein n=1 Tax=Serinicoccus sp. LYQ131 TaxID=3378797 RepID=UPI003852187C